jgi:hypothetical protein
MEPEGLQCGCQAASFRSRLTDADEIRDRRPPGTGKVNHFEGIRAAFRCKSPGSCSLLPLRKSLVEAPNSTDADEECNSCHCLSSRTLSPNTALEFIPSFPSLLKKTRLPLKYLPFHQAAPAFRYSRHQQTSSLGALAYTDHIYRHPRQPSILEQKGVVETVMPSTAGSNDVVDPIIADEKNMVAENTSKRNSQAGSDDEDDFVYPTKGKLTAITIALCLSVFCMALVS